MPRRTRAFALEIKFESLKIDLVVKTLTNLVFVVAPAGFRTRVGDEERSDPIP